MTQHPGVPDIPSQRGFDRELADELTSVIGNYLLPSLYAVLDELENEEQIATAAAVTIDDINVPILAELVDETLPDETLPDEALPVAQSPATAAGSSPIRSRRRLRAPSTAATRRTAVALVASVGGVVGLVEVVPPPVRALLLAAFVLLAPGSAILTRVRAPHGTEALLVPVFGITVLIVVSAGAALAGWWSPVALFVVIAVAGVALVAPNVRPLARDLAR